MCWKTGTTKGGHANRHVWKFDLSIDDSGLGKIEKISYDAYNESTVLVEAVERFRGTNWSLPGTPTGRSDISNQRQQKIL